MKNLIITGANRGIGLGITKVMLSQNHTVIATTRNIENSGDLQNLKNKYSKNLKIVSLDLTNKDSLLSFSKKIPFNHLDILINNAGIMEGNSLNIANTDKTFQVNTLGPMQVTQKLIKKLLNSNSAKVFFMSSKMGSIADNMSGGHYSYRMSKTALNMFCRSFSIDYPKIITMALHPGWVKTDMGGPNAIISIKESAVGLSSLMLKAEKNMSGRFFDYNGNELPW